MSLANAEVHSLNHTKNSTHIKSLHLLGLLPKGRAEKPTSEGGIE